MIIANGTRVSVVLDASCGKLSGTTVTGSVDEHNFATDRYAIKLDEPLDSGTQRVWRNEKEMVLFPERFKVSDVITELENREIAIRNESYDLREKAAALLDEANKIRSAVTVLKNL